MGEVDLADTNYFNEYSKYESVVLYENNRIDDTYDLSIVIPTYKRIDLLRETLLSIIKQKSPKHLKYEVIVVSNDIDFQVTDLKLCFGNLQLTIYGNKNNIGMCGNMNKCASLATGKYIAYLQDDDLLLDDYLCTVEQLIDNGIMSGVGCLIPNRYFYFDENDKVSVFGMKTKRKEKVKSYINKIIRLGCKEHMLQQVLPEDCYRLFYNCFTGGPTCGMLFNKEKLLESEGFNPDYPYSFDYVFFIKYSASNKVILYNNFLAVYRMSDSASNRPQVQYDFFRSEMFLIETMKNFGSNRFNNDILVRFAHDTKSKEAQNLIQKDYNIKSCSQLVYWGFRICRYVKLMRSGLYRKDVINDLPIN